MKEKEQPKYPRLDLASSSASGPPTSSRGLQSSPMNAGDIEKAVKLWRG